MPTCCIVPLRLVIRTSDGLKLGGSFGGSSGGSSGGPGSDIGLWTGATKKEIYHDLADEFLYRYGIWQPYEKYMCFRHVAELLGSFFSGAAQEKRPCDFNWNMFL